MGMLAKYIAYDIGVYANHWHFSSRFPIVSPLLKKDVTMSSKYADVPTFDFFYVFGCYEGGQWSDVYGFDVKQNSKSAISVHILQKRIYI